MSSYYPSVHWGPLGERFFSGGEHWGCRPCIAINHFGKLWHCIASVLHENLPRSIAFSVLTPTAVDLPIPQAHYCGMNCQIFDSGNIEFYETAILHLFWYLSAAEVSSYLIALKV